MGHQARIAHAFDTNGIKNVLVIDDAYDAPSASSMEGDLLEFFDDNLANIESCQEAGLNDEQITAATEAVRQSDFDADEVELVVRELFRKFVDTREARYDPGGQFQLIKNVTLDVLEPLIQLLASCGDNVRVVRAGLTNGEEKFREIDPQVVFLDYYLSPETKGDNLTDNAKRKAKAASIGLLSTLLQINADRDPAVVLMSSEKVKREAQKFRQSVEKLGNNVLALRFRYLQKNSITSEEGKLKIQHDAADALLDTSQGFAFGQVLDQALRKWRSGAETALDTVLKDIASLEPKDFAYLFRFRLAKEGERMGSYLEWLFGENLRAVVAEKVDWQSEEFQQLDKADLSSGIEGAFDGPSTKIATLFQRVRLDDTRVSVEHDRYRMGDLYVKAAEKKVLLVITPDCDLVPRGSGPKVKRLLTMDGDLRSFDDKSASADQFIVYKSKPYALKWNPKGLNTFPVEGSGALQKLSGVEALGTLRPQYAQEAQNLALTDMGRPGLSVVPIMGVDAKLTVYLRIREGKGTTFLKLDTGSPQTATLIPEREGVETGHRVLLRRSYVHILIDTLKGIDPGDLEDADAKSLRDFLAEKNEGNLINGFLLKGAATNDKGPMKTTVKIGSKPDSGKDAPWLQLVVALSEDEMEELLAVDPTLIAHESSEPFPS